MADTDTGVKFDRRSNPSTPRWVKAFGIVVLILILLFATLQFTGIGGSHGPGNHAPSSDTQPSNRTEDHIPPEGVY